MRTHSKRTGTFVVIGVLALLVSVSACGGTTEKAGTMTATKASRKAKVSAVPAFRVGRLPPTARNGVIAFVQGSEIALANRSGGHVETLTSNGGDETTSFDGPAWSADGTKLAFMRRRMPTHEYDDVLVADLSGDSMKVRVAFAASEPVGGHPSWAPDGRLVFSSSEANDSVLDGDILEASNTRERHFEPLSLPGYQAVINGNAELTASDETAAWSLDGQWISFVHSRNYGMKGLLELADPAGTGLLKLKQARGSNPDWAPDESRIAFDAGGDIWTVTPDGKMLARLIGGPSEDSDPAWSPDGRKLLFVRRHGSERDIWIANADGSDQHELIASGTEPAWQPLR